MTDKAEERAREVLMIFYQEGYREGQATLTEKINRLEAIQKDDAEASVVDMKRIKELEDALRDILRGPAISGSAQQALDRVIRISRRALTQEKP